VVKKTKATDFIPKLCMTMS